jgi:hypothetical protein
VLSSTAISEDERDMILLGRRSIYRKIGNQ